VNRYSHEKSKISIVPHRKPYTVDPEGNPGAHFLHDTSRTRPPTGPRPRGCAPLTLAGGYAWIHIHTPGPDFFGSTCQMRSTPHGAYMGPQATITTTPPIQSAAATAWGYLRLRPMPLAPIGALLHVAGGTCGAKKRARERAQRQSGDENEAKRSRVRGLMAAAHLRRRPGRHPAGCGGGGARPPTH
jgi:hypothetical protein